MGRSSAEARRIHCSTEVEVDVERVFSAWSRFEELPRMLRGVRRTKRIGERHVLWDADICGRQVVWEAEVVEIEPDRRICWRSRWGAPNAGEVRFDELPEGGTRVSIDLACWPRGWIERLGAQLGLVTLRVQCDLARFRRFVERAARRPGALGQSS